MDVLRKSGSTLTGSISTVESPKLRVEQMAESFPVEAKHVFASVDAARGLAASIVFIHQFAAFAEAGGLRKIFHLASQNCPSMMRTNQIIDRDRAQFVTIIPTHLLECS